MPTHEYGHVHWCAQLRDVSHAAVVRGLIEGLQGLAQGADADVPERTLTEAWADFLAAQVVGGVNYFKLDDASGSPATDDGFFCDAAEQTSTATPCLEDNWRGPTVLFSGTYPEQSVASGATLRNASVSIGTFVTLLSDAFDGPTSVMGTGTEWTFASVSSPPTLAPGRFRFTPDDEAVQLAPRDWRNIIRVWRDTSHDWTDSSVLSALELVASGRGEPASEVCELRNRHVPDPTTRICKSFNPRVPSDPPGVAILSAVSTGNPAAPGSCEATVGASLFISADGVDSITWQVIADGTRLFAWRTDPIDGRTVSLNPPLAILDEATLPAVLQVDAYRGDQLVSTTTTSISGSPHCFIME